MMKKTNKHVTPIGEVRIQSKFEPEIWKDNATGRGTMETYRISEKNERSLFVLLVSTYVEMRNETCLQQLLQIKTMSF